MKKLCIAILAIGLICAACGWVLAADSFGKYLTVADVSKATGMKGITYSPKNPAKMMGSDMNFMAGASKILSISFTDKSDYDGEKQNYFKSNLAGLGEKAFQGATEKGKPNDCLSFVKGQYCVNMTSPTNFKTNKPYLKMDQMIALAKLMASRL